MCARNGSSPGPSAVRALGAVEPAGAAHGAAGAAAATRIVLCDDDDGLAGRAAAVLVARRLPRSARSRRRQRGVERGRLRIVLRRQRAEQGVRRIRRACKRHAEHLGARSCDALIRTGADMVVLDSRPFDEYLARLDPDRRQRAGRRAGAAHARHRAEARHAGGGQLRGPHPQHHRRAIADQCGRAEQGRGAAQRHDGLEPRRASPATAARTSARRTLASAALAWAKAAAEGVARKLDIARIDEATLARCAPRERARPICSTCAIRPNTRPAMWRARCSAPGGQLVQATDQYVGTLGARIVLRRRQPRCAR